MTAPRGVERAFQRLVARLDYPMFVVTAAASGGRSGCLVGFASQCSISPPRVVVWISKKNHTYEVAQEATALGVHVLGAHDTGLATLFGHETGDEIDKFERCAWHEGAEGAPLLDEAAGWFVGHVLDHLDTGDHLGFLLEPIDAMIRDDPALGFQDVKDLEPGHPA
ncbi:MAG TPA: flavin reductase family protein [Acidimicrobiales bacterium]|nr:flavin reductase family protein [Acidimicrobiales bacterium]